MNDRQAGINKRVAERLYAEGRIDESEYIRAVEHARRRGQRVEEALIELDVVAEAALLKYLATMHKTQFVSTDRMSRAKLDREALRAVPKRLARHFGVFPLVLDRKNDRLIVATPDPDNAQALHELTLASGVGRVVAMVARPEAVIAAIERGYDGDRSRFERLLQARVPEFSDMLMGAPIAPGDARPRAAVRAPDVGDALPPAERGRLRRRDRHSTGTTGPATGEFAPPRLRTGELAPEDHPDFATRARATARTGDWRDLSLPEPPAPEPPAPAPEPPAPEPPAPEPSAGPSLSGHPVTAPSPAAPPSPDPSGSAEGPRAASGAARGGKPSRRSSMFPRPVVGLAPLGPAAAPTPHLFSHPAYLESVRVLVALLENDRRDLRGHSGIVARLAADIGDRINLAPELTSSVVLASYLHDLGKMGKLHLTALNVAQLDDHHDQAQTLLRLPEQLMETVDLPREVIDAVHHMYERVDGGGLPDGLAGKEIPIGARVLAVADSYADLTCNPNNAYERVLTPDEAIDVLRQHAGVVFDASVVEVLERASGGEKILTDLLANRHRVLIVDPDPEETMVLQLRLLDQGFDVHVTRSRDEARAALASRRFALVVCEVDLDTPEGGFDLRTETAQQGMSWVFLSSRDSRQIAERALRLGVDDFIAKPVSHEILVAKLTQLVHRQSERPAPRGVAGSLAQMGLPEIVQILHHGRKTCALDIRQGDRRGQVHFVDGQIVDATWGDAVGETAFYRMIALGDEGDFAVDPAFSPQGEPRIYASPEGLLLEGMRLLDEGKIP